MAEGLSAAVIAVSGAVAVGIISTFIGEDFKRFRSGSVLAAGLAGELSSYVPALPILKKILADQKACIASGNRSTMRFRPIETPRDLIYEANIANLGMLGAALVERVVGVYGNIRAFRMALNIITESHADMDDVELSERLGRCSDALERAGADGDDLLSALHARSTMRFRDRLAATLRAD